MSKISLGTPVSQTPEQGRSQTLKFSPGGQEKNPQFFLILLDFFLIFPQFVLIFFLNLASRTPDVRTLAFPHNREFGGGGGHLYLMLDIILVKSSRN